MEDLVMLVVVFWIVAFPIAFFIAMLIMDNLKRHRVR